MSLEELLRRKDTLFSCISSNMTIRATKFTPEVLLSAPRRSIGMPNPSGTAVLYTVCGGIELSLVFFPPHRI